ncbi:MBL fold metallo-hydrolase, partial [Patescibacteria group bacterium]|nr:MBL fold metallo-hydrolase [Patescibacteria group bacterium]
YMIINWKGQSCFQISTTPIKNGTVSLVIDPFDEGLGLKVPKLQADILMISHDHKDHSNTKAVSGEYLLIDGPGEYDVKTIFIQGIDSFHDNVEGKEKGVNTIYVIESEDIRVCHLGDLGQKELTTEQLEKIGDVDILIIPIGGTYTLDSDEAVKIMSQIEPKIIIPMHYHIPGLKLKIDGVDSFLKSLGIKKIETLPKLTIKKKDISTEEVKIIQLEP